MSFKFSYGTIANFFLTQLFAVVSNLPIIIIAVFIEIAAYGLVINLNVPTILEKVLLYTITIVFAVLIITVIIATFMPRKIIIKTDEIVVKRRYLNYDYIIRGFTDRIDVKNIEYCCKYTGEKWLLWRGEPTSIRFFDWSDLIEIYTKDKRKYLIPIKNSERFIEHLSKELKK